MSALRCSSLSSSSGAARSNWKNQRWKVWICGGRPDWSSSACRPARRGASWRACSGPRPLIRSASSRWASSQRAAENASSQSFSRLRISPAALRVKVMASTSCGWAPSSKARRMRETSIQVLPAPAQASTTTLRDGSQAVA
jgi:hypothetical protein